MDENGQCQVFPALPEYSRSAGRELVVASAWVLEDLGLWKKSSVAHIADLVPTYDGKHTEYNSTWLLLDWLRTHPFTQFMVGHSI